MNTLLQALRSEGNKTRTENGALTNITTFDSVLDLFFHAPAKRGQDNTKLLRKVQYSEHYNVRKIEQS